MKKQILFFFLITSVLSCNTEDIQPIDYVNPFIGTGGHGHTYPGVSMPLGWCN
tara:strand:- start:169 stop:327 length:159 start_codon:yes stop_codon:yes gene_type:complete